MDVPRAAELRQQLKAAGLRVTQPRLQVLGLLTELGGHRSVDEMVALLERRGCVLPRASVYGIVEALVAKRLVALAETGPGRALYELAGPPHHHLVCVECGAVVDVPCAEKRSPCLELGAEYGTMHHAQVTYRGICRGCAQGNTVV